MQELLVNPLGAPSLHRKSVVRLSDCGRKTKHNNNNNIVKIFVRGPRDYGKSKLVKLKHEIINSVLQIRNG